MNRIAKTTLATLLLLAACKKEEQLPLYEPVQVVRRDIVVSADAAGTIEPIMVVEVKSKASGEIIEMTAETGDIVQQGELLVQVDAREPRNQVLQAEADLDVARAQLATAEANKRRVEAMHSAQLVSEQEYEQAQLTFANARAQLVRAERSLQTARDQLDDTNVRAPISGTIIQKSVERGQVITSATREVSGGTVLLRMADLSQVQVRALVDETDIGKIQADMPATITVDAYPNQPFQGTVLKIEPQSTTNQNVTMFPVLIRIPNPRGLLRPGMNAQVELQVARQTAVLAIPNAALRTQRDVASAAAVLGLDFAQVEQTLARADSQRAAETAATPQTQRSSQGGLTEPSPPAPQQAQRQQAAPQAPPQVAGAQQGQRQGMGGPGGPGGSQMPLPAGVTREQWDAISAKRRNQEPLTPAESTIAARVRENFQRQRDSGQQPAIGGQGAPQVAGAQPGAGAQQQGGMQLPPGVTQEQLTAIFSKMRGGQQLTPAEQAIMTRARSQMGGAAGNQRRRFGANNNFQFGGSYIVFVLRDGRPSPVRIRTGVTDLDYSEVVSGLTERDTVLLLPSASLLASQAEWRERFQRMSGGGAVPGMRQTGGAATPGGGGQRQGGR
jgi:HlyD family secretion protein